MDKQSIVKIASEFIKTSELNYISKDDAISEELVGMKIFEEPLFAFGSADDENFKLLKDSNAIGEHFLLPNEWLPNAKTVITFFLPFTDEVIKGNKKDKKWPSNQWLHGRIEGQILVKNLCLVINSKLNEANYESIIPTLDNRFWSSTESETKKSFSSNWSERHAAFICGLGTFGLSKGIITEKGMAGRLGSIITKLQLRPDDKNYTDIYEYCTMCGACVKTCPVDAISIINGKDHKKCSNFLDLTSEKFKPRYGCGKCQVSVPCERKIPKKNKKRLED